MFLGGSSSRHHHWDVTIDLAKHIGDTGHSMMQHCRARSTVSCMVGMINLPPCGRSTHQPDERLVEHELLLLPNCSRLIRRECNLEHRLHCWLQCRIHSLLQILRSRHWKWLAGCFGCYHVFHHLHCRWNWLSPVSRTPNPEGPGRCPVSLCVVTERTVFARGFKGENVVLSASGWVSCSTQRSGNPPILVDVDILCIIA